MASSHYCYKSCWHKRAAVQIPITGQILPIGDTARIWVGGWSTMAPWPQWESLGQLLQMGVMPYLAEGH